MERLHSLQMHLSGCDALYTLSGFEALEGLKALQELTLDLSSSAIQDLRALGAGLGGMEQLQMLTASFKLCEALSALGGFEE
eukprot:15412655-Heterocapsa_arctica.AAC.1